MIDLKEIRNKIFTKNNLYCLCVISIIFFLDRYTKLLILNNFNENSYYLNDFLNLDLIWNIGIGFGLLSTKSSLFYNLVTILIGIVILLLCYFFIISNKIDKLIFSIIIGGGINLFLVTQFVLLLDPWYMPRYMIPLAGMIFSSAMNGVSLAAERLQAEIDKGIKYNYAKRVAFKASLIPVINSLFAV